MKNERRTENLVRNDLRKLGYYHPGNRISVDEQQSENETIRKLLRGASKTGGVGIGCPEFLATSPQAPDFIVVVECKADPSEHASSQLDRPAQFAVDGALHYARRLSRAFNVIAVGISGQTESEMKVSTFLWPKDSETFRPLVNEADVPIEALLPFDDFVRLGSWDHEVALKREQDLMAFARDLHVFMRDHAKLTESEKPMVVSGTLIALGNRPFAHSYDRYSVDKLPSAWLQVIKDEIEAAKILHSSVEKMMVPYANIAVHPELGKPTAKYPGGVLKELIGKLYEKVWPFISIYKEHDVVGKFYGEFLKYTGGDKKSLGIVLTPRHITELFARLANLKVWSETDGEVRASKVLDTCAGTCGFLISAGREMREQAKTQAQISYIKENCLVGVEQQPSMHALGASNLLLWKETGGGLRNLYQGSCFDPRIKEEIKKHQCDIGMLNPPYAQGDNSMHELEFLKNMLECLVKGGIGIAIVPMSCALTPDPRREELLRHHTLEAVMSMPEELFYPVGVITCVMVFTAGVPHGVSDRKTWFGYWRNDGFVKTKHMGRVDLYEQWPAIRERWVEQFRNREVHPGVSVMRKVTHEDEWCAEAYMETDYTTIKREEFEEAVKRYAVWQLLGSTIEESHEDEAAA
jgi:type I restriction enzyme M protein